MTSIRNSVRIMVGSVGSTSTGSQESLKNPQQNATKKQGESPCKSKAQTNKWVESFFVSPKRENNPLYSEWCMTLYHHCPLITTSLFLPKEERTTEEKNGSKINQSNKHTTTATATAAAAAASGGGRERRWWKGTAAGGSYL